MRFSLLARITAEFVGTAFLLMAVVGSGIMGERLAGGNGCNCLAGKYVVLFAVGAYITAAYWFTASTSFANPAMTLARAATGTFSGFTPLIFPASLLHS